VRLRIGPWQLAALLVLLCAGILAGLFWYRNRISTAPSDLVAWLPTEDAVTAWVDMDGLRQSRLLDALAGARVTEESEYSSFVQQTRFDYREDLRAFGLAVRSNRLNGDKDIFAIARGTFDWKRIYAYFKAHGGECAGAFCHMPASRPGRYISLYPIRSDLMAFAVGSDPYDAYLVGRRAGKAAIPVPARPIWILLSSAALHSKDLFPEGTHAFASALEDANRVALSLGPTGDHLELTLDADCRNVDAASRLLVQLEQTTNFLRSLIAREHQTPNPRDLSGILTAGNFRRDDRHVLGAWPIGRPFIDAVVNGGAQ